MTAMESLLRAAWAEYLKATGLHSSAIANTWTKLSFFERVTAFAKEHLERTGRLPTVSEVIAFASSRCPAGDSRPGC